MDSDCQHELGQLPREIWAKIFETHQLCGNQTDDEELRHERLRLNTLLSISSTCKAFYHLVRPVLYRTLDFTVHSSLDRLAALISTLVEDPDVWQYVRQIRIPTLASSYSFSGLELETGAAGLEESRLVTHLELLGISPELIRDIVQSNHRTTSRGNFVPALLLCLCRNVRTFNLRYAWRAAGSPSVASLIGKTLSQRKCMPALSAVEARPELLLDRRPCAEIKSMRIEGGKSIEIKDLDTFLELPSLTSFEMSGIYSTSLPIGRYEHRKRTPLWGLQNLKIERCTINACFVVDVVWSCRQLRSLDIDVRHTPGRPAFMYNHLGQNLWRYSTKLEVLICRDYSPNNRVAFLTDEKDSLRPLASLRKLALPLDILWDVPRHKTFSFHGALPISLEELQIFAVGPAYSDEKVEAFAASFMELMGSEEYPRLTCIRIAEHETCAKIVFENLGAELHGWKAKWDVNTKDYVFTKSIDSGRQARDGIASLRTDTAPVEAVS